MYDEVSSSNPPDLPMPAEGAYVWHLEVIVVAVGIDPVSREYETGPVADSASIKKKKKKNWLIGYYVSCALSSIVNGGWS
jgi:hypothetical protein